MTSAPKAKRWRRISRGLPPRSAGLQRSWSIARAKRNGIWEETLPVPPQQLSEDAKVAAQECWLLLLLLRNQKVWS